MPADPFDPLRQVDPPDQWDDIAARAATEAAALDVEDAGRRRPRAVAMLAVAAAVLLVVGGIALARTGDPDTARALLCAQRSRARLRR